MRLDIALGGREITIDLTGAPAHGRLVLRLVDAAPESPGQQPVADSKGFRKGPSWTNPSTYPGMPGAEITRHLRKAGWNYARIQKELGIIAYGTALAIAHRQSRWKTRFKTQEILKVRRQIAQVINLPFSQVWGEPEPTGDQ